MLADAEASEQSVAPAHSPGMIAEIHTDLIETNPYQPRQDFDPVALQELADSIKVQGIIQPITVRKLSDQSYQLISGERRLQASRIAGLETIPAYIRTANDQQMLEMALIENIQRENLNPIEVALSYQRLISECNLSQENLGERVGKNRSTVTNYLRLLRLPPEIQAGLRDGVISMGHAKTLVNVDSVELQLSLYRQCIAEGWSVRKIEEVVRDLFQGKEKAQPKTTPVENPEFRRLQSDLASYFGAQVKVKAKGNKGEISIPFQSVEDLNRILEIIKK